MGITSGFEYDSVTLAINQLVSLEISNSVISTFNKLAVIRNNNWTTRISTTKPAHWVTATYASYNFGVLINNSLLTSSNTGTWYNAATGIETTIAKDCYYNCLMFTVNNSGYNALAVARNTNMPSTINAMATKFYKKNSTGFGTYLEAIILQAYASKGSLKLL